VISHVGKYLKGDSLQFVTLQLLMAQRHPKGRRYTDADKLQALALYNSGPKAYKHLANIFLLPSKVSLSNWLRNMKCSPGFHKESFNGLSERLKYMSNRDKNCTLLIDEISIKSNLQYDRHNDIIIGYEDYGHYCPRSCTKPKVHLFSCFEVLHPIGVSLWVLYLLLVHVRLILLNVCY
jgi:transposase-like protein